MGRQTAFPGTFVDTIRVEKPPFDEPGVVQEFVGQGVTKEFEALRRVGEITEETIGDFIQSAEDMIGPIRDEFRIVYTYQMRAVPTGQARGLRVFDDVQKRVLSARGRAITRLKNPFEPDVVEVRSVSKNTTLSDEKTGDVYEVVVSVTK